MSETNVNSSDDKARMTSKSETETVEEDDEQRINGSISGKTGSTGIAAMLKSSGPVVKCVLLKHMRSSGRDVHPHLDQSVIAQKLHKHNDLISNDDTSKPAAIIEMNEHLQHHHREVLTELIEELEVDTTPGKNGVQKILGGNTFTFIGQYPEEGIVLMARADQFHDLDVIDTLSVLELKDFIQDANLDIDITTVVDKSELIQAVKDAQLPLNPHQLQPPFHDCPIRGDILLMRIADDEDEEEEVDDDDDDDRKTSASISKAIQEITAATAKPNDEFFLDYTKDEYIAFASRTDVVATPIDEDDDDDDEDDEGENDEEDDDEEEDDGIEDEEEDKHLLLNLILSEVIKSFREDNGRGPDSVELLDLRSRIAEQLNLSLPPPAPPIPEDDRKRKTNDDEDYQDDNEHHSTSPSPKKVKFTPDILEKEEENENKIEGVASANDEIDVHKTIDHDADDTKEEGHNDR
jgi:Family of unknown function (DUF5880)